MANIFLRDPTYITIAQVKDTTDKAALAALGDDALKVLIARAEDLVDRYIISYGTPYDEDQTLIFPVEDEDGASSLPDDITKGTFFVVEQVYENGDLISGAVETGSGDVKSEKVGDRSVTYDVGTTTTNNNAKFLGIPPEAIAFLSKYRNIFYKSVI